MEVFSDIKTSKNIQKFECIVCDFSCCKKGDWGRHILTSKHINIIKSIGIVTTNTTHDKLKCNLCGKEYKSRNGLWNHKKKCNNENKILEEEQTNTFQKITPELVMELIKNNNELQQIILKQHNTLNNLSNSLNTNNT
jgi:hypothetical protein